MTSQEKAQELFDKTLSLDCDGWNISSDTARECAIICVDEILALASMQEGRHIPVLPEDREYWNDVKLEISKL